jgi:ribonuclease BN (tRNA processing enzyme)
MIRFLVLGSGAAVPSPAHGQPAHWVVVDGHPLLVDPGPGALERLISSPAGPDSVDGIHAVLLTHLHLDHCADLAPLLFALHSPVPAETRPLQLIGPPGLEDYLGALRGLYGDWLDPRRRPLQVLEVEPGIILAPVGEPRALWSPIPDSTLTGPAVATFAAYHPQSRLDRTSLGCRFHDREGHTAVYSGDTGPCSALTSASQDADLLVVECSTPDELATEGHMTPSLVAALCAAARPRHVVLVHLYPPVLLLDLPRAVGRRFDGPVTVARDGDLFDIPPTGSRAPGS